LAHWYLKVRLRKVWSTVKRPRRRVGKKVYLQIREQFVDVFEVVLVKEFEPFLDYALLVRERFVGFRATGAIVARD
jgi:hypothetical protein